MMTWTTLSARLMVSSSTTDQSTPKLLKLAAKVILLYTRGIFQGWVGIARKLRDVAIYAMRCAICLIYGHIARATRDFFTVLSDFFILLFEFCK